jgi:hypothetical protein
MEKSFYSHETSSQICKITRNVINLRVLLLRQDIMSTCIKKQVYSYESFSQILRLNNLSGARDKTMGITEAFPKKFRSGVPGKQARNTNLLIAGTTVNPGALNRAECNIAPLPKENVQYPFVPQQAFKLQ